MLLSKISFDKEIFIYPLILQLLDTSTSIFRDWPF